MLVYLSKLLPQFVYPAGLAALLLFISLFQIKKKPKKAIWLVIVALLLIAVGGNAYFSAYLTRSMEWRYMPPTEEIQADVIVVLGGGTESPDSPRQMVEVNGAGDRVLYAAKLYNEGAAPVIILSGGNLEFSEARGYTPAEEMRAMMITLGIPEKALILQDQSQNTEEDALYTKAILTERGFKKIILVTSAAHMDRAVMNFRDSDLEIIPAPTDYSITQQSWDNLMRWDWKTVLLNLVPSSNSLNQTSSILHEYLGIMVCRVKLLF
ncbi:MAG: YdcF family protein [Anaerolineaceae bacterium]